MAANLFRVRLKFQYGKDGSVVRCDRLVEHFELDDFPAFGGAVQNVVDLNRRLRHRIGCHRRLIGRRPHRLQPTQRFAVGASVHIAC